MILAPYVMTEDERHPNYGLVYTKLIEPIHALVKRTHAILQTTVIMREYAQHGFIYRGIRYLGLDDPFSRRPLPTLIDEVCQEFSTIHTEYLEILELKDRMFRALRQHQVHLPPSKFMDGELYPEYSPYIDFYLKVQEEYLEYIGRFLILRGIK